MSTLNPQTVVLLRRKDVESITGLGRSAIYSLISKGKFPRPVKITARAVAWSQSEVIGWIEEKLSSPH